MDTFSIFGDAFGEVISNGVNRLMPEVNFLAYAMITLAVCFLAASCMFRGGHLMGAGIWMVIISGFYLLVIDNIQDFGAGIMESAVYYGLTAGGSSMSPDAFLRSPDAIFTIGYAKAADLFELAELACVDSYFGCFGSIQTWFPVQAAAWFVYGTFALAAFMVLGISMLFKLALLAGMILLPLAVFPPTAYLGFIPIKAVIHFSVQLMVLAMVITVANLAFTKLAIGTVPGVDSVTPIIIGCVVFLGMVLGASGLTAALTQGGMLAGGALLAAPIGMAMTAGRSAAGHLDTPLTTAVKGAGTASVGAAQAVTQRVRAMRTAANRGNGS